MFRTLTLCLTFWLATAMSTENQEEEIRQTVKRYETAMQNGDTKAISASWTENGRYINPIRGVEVQGRESIEQEFDKLFKEAKIEKADIKLNNIQFTDADNATATGLINLTFNSQKTPVEHAFIARFVKQEGNWRLDEVRQIPLKATEGHADKLNGLAWLVGDWVDSDEDIQINNQFKWDKNHNLLIQTFKMSLYGQEVLDGRQIIAWDPIEQRIRSWTFDSDGGFGEGSWYQQDGSWFVKNSYTLADGRKASAVNVYKKIDDNSFSWASVGRDVNGQILPNIEPITIKKVNQ